jgi:hypothetical protein
MNEMAPYQTIIFRQAILHRPLGSRRHGAIGDVPLHDRRTVADDVRAHGGP